MALIMSQKNCLQKKNLKESYLKLKNNSRKNSEVLSLKKSDQLKLIYKFLIIAIIILAACGRSKQEPDVKTGDQIKDQAVDGGTLVVGIPGEPDALNPLTALTKPARDIISLIFRQLADVNKDLYSFTPRLAKEWIFSHDSLKITFHLRTDVQWHDGKPFQAKDVVFTHTLQTDPDVVWDGISFKEDIQVVYAENDSTVVYEFRKKTPTMLMDAVEGYIIPEHILLEISPKDIHTSGFNRNPIGLGPFKFVNWISQQSIRLEKFNDYYESDKPHLDRIIFQIVPNNITLWQQVLSGDVDLMENVPPRSFVRLKEDWDAGEKDIRPISFLGRQYDFIGWNLIDYENYSIVMDEAGQGEPDISRLLKPNKLFGSQKVRAALTMAIDRKTITKIVNHGLAAQMHGPVPLIWWVYDESANEILPFDPDGAKRYLADEGWTDSDGDGILDKDGVKFSFEMATNSGNERREQALTLIQNQLHQIGVEMIPRILEAGLLFGRMLPSRDFDAVLIGWNVGLKMELTSLFHTTSILYPFNFVSYSSSDFDNWEEIAKKSLNKEITRDYWNKVASRLSHDLPYTWLYYKMETVGLNSRFKDVKIDKRGVFINVEDWWIPTDVRTKTDMMVNR